LKEVPGLPPPAPKHAIWQYDDVTIMDLTVDDDQARAIGIDVWWFHLALSYKNWSKLTLERGIRVHSVPCSDAKYTMV
jgi:hypothetical protein